MLVVSIKFELCKGVSENKLHCGVLAASMRYIKCVIYFLKKNTTWCFQDAHKWANMTTDTDMLATCLKMPLGNMLHCLYHHKTFLGSTLDCCICQLQPT